MVQLALRSALSDRAAENRVAVVDAWNFSEPRTREAKATLEALGLEGKVLVVFGPDEDVVAKSFRNLAGVAVLPATGAVVADIVGAAQVLVTEEALAQLTARAHGDTRPTSPAGTDTAT